MKDKDFSKPGPSGGEKTKVKVTLYKNGYMINDDHEDFRTYDSPSDKEFIKDLKEGYVPKELMRKYPRGVDCGLEDKR